MPPKRAAAGRRLDLSIKGGGAFRSPEPGLAEKTAAELEAATLRALDQEEAGDDSAQAEHPGSGAGSPAEYRLLNQWPLLAQQGMNHESNYVVQNRSDGSCWTFGTGEGRQRVGRHFRVGQRIIARCPRQLRVIGLRPAEA